MHDSVVAVAVVLATPTVVSQRNQRSNERFCRPPNKAKPDKRPDDSYADGYVFGLNDYR